MGRRSHPDRRAGAGDGMTDSKKVEKTAKKTSDNARLFEVGRRLAATHARHLAHTLEKFGAKASSLLLPEGERFKRMTSTPYFIRIPLMQADMMSAILLSLAEEHARGPGKQWPPDIRDAAWLGLFDGKKINPLAREISEKTGQPFSSTRRRLQEIKTSAQFKEVKEVEERTRARSGEASLEDDFG